MRPPEVLDHQAALIDYLDSSHYHSYMENFTADMVRKGKLVSTMTGKQMCETLQLSLRIAQPFHVQAEMMPLLRAAAMDLDEDDHIVHDRLPAESGFLVFDEPWAITDTWGLKVGIAAVHWRHGAANINGTQRAGIWLTYFSDVHDEDDEVTQNLIADLGADVMRRLGRFHVNHVTWWGYGDKVGPAEVVTDEQYARFATEGLSLAEATPNTQRMIVGLFRLLNQVIVEVSDVAVDRDRVRRMTRKNLPVRVQTIKLRRKERLRPETVHGEGHVDWQHQWPVRGHWAWRKCGPEHPSAEPYEKGHHTRVYVAPYWKGPEGAPILLTEKVWGLAQ